MKKTRISIVLTSLLTLSIATLGFSAWLIPGVTQGFNSGINIEIGDIRDLSYLEIISATPFTFSDTTFIENYDPNTGLGTKSNIGNILLNMNIDYSKINVSARSKIIIDLNYSFKQDTNSFDFSSYAAKDTRGNYFTYNGITNYGVTIASVRNKITYEFLLDPSITTLTPYEIKLPFSFPKQYITNLLDISFLIEPRVEGLIV